MAKLVTNTTSVIPAKKKRILAATSRATARPKTKSITKFMTKRVVRKSRIYCPVDKGSLLRNLLYNSTMLFNNELMLFCNFLFLDFMENNESPGIIKSMKAANTAPIKAAVNNATNTINAIERKFGIKTIALIIPPSITTPINVQNRAAILSP